MNPTVARIRSFGMSTSIVGVRFQKTALVNLLMWEGSVSCLGISFALGHGSVELGIKVSSTKHIITHGTSGYVSRL